jgi:hypothetical protein
MNKKQRKKDYTHYREIDLRIPLQFLVLCRALDVPAEQVLFNFMANVGQELYAQGSEQKTKAIEYFLSCGYGQDKYPEQEIREAFTELSALAGSKPEGCTIKFMDMNAQWWSKLIFTDFKKRIDKNR